MTSERNYLDMSPEELKSELSQLYGYVSSQPSRPGRLFSGFNREMSQMLTQRLERILKQSELTGSMQKLVVANFSLSVRTGVENGDRDLLLGEHHPFTPSGAEFVGKQLIESYAEQYGTTVNIIVRLEVGGHDPSTPDTVRLFLKAKEEFEEKYI